MNDTNDMKPAAPSMRCTPKVLTAILAVVCLVLIGASSLVYAVYFRRSNEPIVRTLGSWMPAARVGNTYVTYGQFLDSRDTLRTYLASSLAQSQGAPQALTPDLEQASLDRLMREDAVDQLAAQHHISVSDADVMASFAQMVAMSSSTVPNVGSYLKSTFNWNEQQYRDNIVKPAILEERVAETMASDTQTQFNDLQQNLTDRFAKPDVQIFLRF